MACGNNCTLVLAGGVAFPTLFERTAAVIRGNPALWADVGGALTITSRLLLCVRVRMNIGVRLLLFSLFYFLFFSRVRFLTSFAFA